MPPEAVAKGIVRGCSHKTFLNGKPHSFKGTEGVVGLRRWIEKVRHVFEDGSVRRMTRALDSDMKGADVIEALTTVSMSWLLMCPELRAH
ncbi:hypothetical protein Tco_1090440 [Tanacetum coccineum]|uniref:Reverse transcriptase domain-containing protein n=1 Tax=Tanacetum coccineum TaxID=301880 RepID=A0ABQ5I477_9ASTR